MPFEMDVQRHACPRSKNLASFTSKKFGATGKNLLFKCSLLLCSELVTMFYMLERLFPERKRAEKESFIVLAYSNFSEKIVVGLFEYRREFLTRISMS